MAKKNQDIKSISSEIISSNSGIRQVSIVDEMRRSYIDYAMSVIVRRALPDVRDGLKPVQRRILYAMYERGILPSSSYSKCAKVVGDVLGKYHPHGDVSVYDALVRMVQNWTLRYPLIDGQGNFGSLDGDGAAAYRYTECRLQKISLNLVEDIEKDTANFSPNFTGEEKEPDVLPTNFPNLLANGSDGIAVGMATKIPPHNLGELIDATIAMISEGNQNTENIFKYSEHSAKDYYEAVNFSINEKDIRFPVFESNLTTDDLMKYIKGPDFPTAGEIFNINDIKLGYETGRGRILMRAVAMIEETKSGKNQIVVTQLPYQVNKARLAERIYDLVKDGKVEGISDLRDESTEKEGIRLVVELKKGTVPNVILNKLFKYTEMQSAFNLNMLALVDGEPRVLSLRDMLEQFIRHRYEVVIRAAIHDLNENKARAHILEGLKIALDHIDEIINTIRSSKSAEAAKGALMEKFNLTDVQAQAILDMQLRRLAALERQKIEDEYDQVMSIIKELISLLDSQEKIEQKIIEGLQTVKEKFADKRKTVIRRGLPGEFSDEDLVEKEDIIVSISRQGYIKRVKESEYRAQIRGGKGTIGSTTKEGDNIEHLVYCNTHSEVLLFSNKGKVYALRAYEIPEYQKKSKGLPLVNLISVEQGELITSVLIRAEGSENVVADEDQTQEGEVDPDHQRKTYGYLFMATKKGTVKKVKLGEFEQIRRNGLIAITLDSDDELLFVRPTNGESDVLMMTKKAQTVRFDEAKVSPTGRMSRGVRGIRLQADDAVIMMDVVRHTEDRVLVVSEKGFGKITPLDDFPKKGRGTKGMLGYKTSSKTGQVAAARIIDHPKKEIIIMSEKGQTIRTAIESIRESGRVTGGVIIFRMPEGDRVAAIAVF